MGVTIEFEGQEYTLTYNEQSGYYEIELNAPSQRGNLPNRCNLY